MDDESVETADNEKGSLHITDDGVLGMIQTNDPAVERSMVTCNSIDDIFSLSDALPDTSTIEHFRIDLDNQYQTVEAEHASKISDSIARMPLLERFEMKSCYWRGNEVIRSITPALANAEAIRVLSMVECGIESCAMKAISDSLDSNHSLTRLDLSGNNLERDGAMALSSLIAKQPNLERLALYENHIGAEEATALARALVRKQSFRHLDLSSNHIGSEGAGAMAGLFLCGSIISHLNLSGNDIGSAGCSALARAIAENQSLKELDLSDNPIGNTGVIDLASPLATINTLKSVSLVGTTIEKEGAEAIARAIAVNPSIEFLDIRQANGPMRVEEEDAEGAYDEVFMDVIYNNESTASVLSSNHTLKTLIPAGDALRSLLAANGRGTETAKHTKLIKFMNERPEFVLSTGMEDKCMPTVLEKVYRYQAMYEILLNMPDLFKSAGRRSYRQDRKRPRSLH